MRLRPDGPRPGIGGRQIQGSIGVAPGAWRKDGIELNPDRKGFRGRRAGLLLAALALAACGGSNSGVRVSGQGSTPADAHEKGAWSEVFAWPIIPIHVALLPDGRVFSFGSDVDPNPFDEVGANPTGVFNYNLWTPGSFAADAHLLMPNQTLTDIFCAAQLVLPQRGAGVLVAGGDSYPRPDPDPDNDVLEAADDGNENSTVLDYSLAEPSLRRGQDMNAGRWYATVTTLLNGEVYVQGGNSLSRVSGEFQPEVRGVDGQFRPLTGVDTSALRYYYPRNFVAPDRRVFGFDTRGQMYYVDTSGTGAITPAGSFADAGDVAGSVTGGDSTAAMFRPGRILNFGGDSAGAIVVDIRSGAPSLAETGTLSTQRRLVTGTVLADGRVLATGGSGVYNLLVGVNNHAEIWDPVSGQWRLGSEGTLARLYHSTALLLPDASVLVAGGGGPGPLNNLNGEIYYPPYLFKPGGGFANRPTINATTPADPVVGRRFTLRYTDIGGSPARVVLVKTGSTTHGWNMDQRFVELSFTRTADPQTLSVHMPSRAADTPPGYYLLFLINAQGVPSRAKMVFVDVAGAAEAGAPRLAAPGDRSDAVGEAVRLAASASDPNGDALDFAAAGLPPGLSLGADGVLSGAPTAAGSYDTVLSVSDGLSTASANFVWTVD